MIEYQTDDLKQSDCLVVAFTGIGHGLGGIPFEFHRTLTGVDCAALYIRDRGRRWYQYDTGDNSLPQVAERIAKFKEKCGARRLVMLGNSMGAFGALLFSTYTPTDAVLAFGPQTVICPDVAGEMGEHRWDELWRAIAAFPCGDLVMRPPPSAHVTIIFGESDTLDRLHAERLAKIWGCHLLPVANASHDAASVLRNSGGLAKLISAAISGEPLT